jgi:putative acetyltransferase
MGSPTIEPERSGDEATIAAVTAAAFHNHPYSHGEEPGIIARLRAAGALSVSLVAREGTAIIGHVAASPIALGATHEGWYGLGPISVRPDRQRHGIGSLLMRAVLETLRANGARGCVLVGEPAFYRHFGFTADPSVSHAGVPPEYCLTLRFVPGTEAGAAQFHPAFGV